MLLDPWFYAVAVPAVMIFGISKGGLGGGLGIVSVPLMALYVSPAEAAAIMLPLLCLMDLIGLKAYYRFWDRRVMAVMLPGAMAGIVLGSIAFGYLSEQVVKLLLGMIALIFTLNYYLRRGASAPARPHSPLKGGIWAAVAGLTSTIAHAGGPPANVYLLPLRLDKTVFVGSMVVLFAAVNYVKLVPYWYLGLFDTSNLEASLVLAPVAALGMMSGIWLHTRIKEKLFYNLCYALVLLTGIKLVADGLGLG